jgi:hypothetical protein
MTLRWTGSTGDRLLIRYHARACKSVPEHNSDDADDDTGDDDSRQLVLLRVLVLANTSVELLESSDDDDRKMPPRLWVQTGLGAMDLWSNCGLPGRHCSEQGHFQRGGGWTLALNATAEDY